MKRGPHPSLFPRLLFGNELAEEVLCAQDYGDRMAKVLTTLNAFESKGASGAFRARSFSVDINGLVLTANACTPVHVGVSTSAAVNLIVPFCGVNVSTYDRRSYEWRAGQSAMYFPEVGRGGYSSTRSVLTVKLDLARLLETMRCMQGTEDLPRIALDAPRLLPLHKGPISLLNPVQHIGSIIDGLATRPDLLAALNLDDTVYRWMGLLFASDKQEEQPKSARVSQSRDRRLDYACDYALSRLESGITLTDMEREAGMSRRNLQYAFTQRFGRTPMEWLREQRLIKARQRLLNPLANETVTSIALACGFGKPSAFAQHYRLMFGELPSETLFSKKFDRM